MEMRRRRYTHQPRVAALAATLGSVESKVYSTLKELRHRGP